MSRPFDRDRRRGRALAAEGVTEVTLLGQNVNSYGRDLQLAARQAGDGVGAAPPAVRRPAACGRRGRRASAGCASPARTPRTCVPRRSPRWPRRRRCASTSTTRCSRAATASWPRCTVATPPSATSSGSPRRAASIADLAVSTDIIVGFPGETEADFQRTMEVAAAAEYDYAYMFIFSPRDRAPRRPRWRPTSSTRRWSASGSSGCASSSSAAALAKHEARVGRVEEVLVEGPSKRDPSVTSGRTRQNKLVHFTPPHAAAHRQLRHGRDHARCAAPPHRATSSSRSPSRRTGCASPSPPSEPSGPPLR